MKKRTPDSSLKKNKTGFLFNLITPKIEAEILSQGLQLHMYNCGL